MNSLPIHPPTIVEMVLAPQGASPALRRAVTAWNAAASDLVGERLALHRLAEQAVTMDTELTHAAELETLETLWADIRAKDEQLTRRGSWLDRQQAELADWMAAYSDHDHDPDPDS